MEEIQSGRWCCHTSEGQTVAKSQTRLAELSLSVFPWKTREKIVVQIWRGRLKSTGPDITHNTTW